MTLWSNLRARPWLRAQACAAATFAVLFAGSATYGAHRAKDSAKRLGSEILSSVAPDGRGDIIEFNGARFYFAATVVEDGLEDVVARATRVCEEQNRDVEQELGPALGRLPVGEKLDASKLLLLQSEESSAVGEVGCWANRKGGLLASVKRFAESGNLAELGSLSYLRAERHGKKTLVRTLWSEGPLTLSQMFPAEGDAPGVDLPDWPRPASAARILSARVVGTERQVVGYDTAQGVAQLNRHYDEALTKSGWKELKLSDTATPTQRAFERGGRRVLLTFTPSERGTAATFIAMPQQ